jgi:glycosyltransferase involved in cell wall biosynthesis
MSLGLTVVTHTNIQKNRDIRRCIESVRKALPKGAKHIVMELEGSYDDFIVARYEAMKLDDVVIFVDDDDYISEDSLWMCMDALNANDVGIAFTREIKVMEDGSHKPRYRATHLGQISNHPEIIHHMVAYRTKYVTERSFNLAMKYKCGTEWTTKVDAAYTAGAIFVPMDGYYWVQHTEQTHKISDIQDRFKNNFVFMREEMKTWIHKDKEIPVWTGIV